MIRLFKLSFGVKHTLSNRGGRFLTIYAEKGRYNGKVLRTNPFWATIQLSRTGDNRIVRVRNWEVRLVSTDHKTYFAAR